MSLRISESTKNNLIDTCFEPEYDAGFTKDPAMDKFLFEEEDLFFRNLDLMEELDKDEV